MIKIHSFADTPYYYPHPSWTSFYLTSSVMKQTANSLYFLYFIFCLVLPTGCKRDITPSPEAISDIDLKRGDIVMCNTSGKPFGTVDFITSCSPKTKKEFDLAVALLHSFEYDEAEKVFAKIIDMEPGCAMAYWGVAMSNYHQVWPSPPSQAELEKGNKAITIAQSLPNVSKKEADYINAIALFYKDWATTDHRTRNRNFVKAMEGVYNTYPNETEVGILYALALIGSADLADKTFANQKKAGAILNGLYPGEPDHPGIVHYIIHSYDSPELAHMALPAARKYASIAPASAHAQHMPSHIFTRLGLWDESIQSNLTSIESAVCYAENAGIKGHWDEELHGMDYLVYAYLQKGENDLAKKQIDYLKSIEDVYPSNFKVAYAYAAIPARFLLENRMWKEAAALEIFPDDFPWAKFPWQKAIFHFARLMGAARMNQSDAARTDLKILTTLYDTLIAQKDTYKANQVFIQMKSGEAWITLAEGKPDVALDLMKTAADMEDLTEKSSVTPGEVLPAKELLGDMLLQINKPAEAVLAFEEDLKKHPNRFNGIYGAAVACEKSLQSEKAINYYRQLISVANPSQSNRPEIAMAEKFLKLNTN